MAISTWTFVIRACCAVAFCAVLAGCAPAGMASSGTAAGASSPTDLPVIQAAEALFAGMEARDTAALRRLFTADARIVSIRVQPGSEPVVQTRPVADFIASVGRSTEVLRERMWDPRVEVEGEMATLWAPYDFHLGERFSHCGVDAFDYVRTSFGWQIVALSYTVQTTGCEPAPRAR